MTDQKIREILAGFPPTATILFLSKDGQRMVLAVSEPAQAVIDIYPSAGYSVEAHSVLQKAS